MRESAMSMRENFPQITYVKIESVREKNPEILENPLHRFENFGPFFNA